MQIYYESDPCARIRFDPDLPTFVHAAID